MKIRNWNNLARKAEVMIYDPGSGFAHTPRGNGRNYGDAAIGFTVTDMRTLKQELRIENGCLVADSGWTLAEMLSFCIEKGFWFPVVPGTQYVTLGGMIAADVHGKDHASIGTIGRWVQQLTLRLSDGTIVHCSPESERTLFRLTIGGMGSTGSILQAVIALESLTGTSLKQKTVVCNTFAEVVGVFNTTSERFSVAWMDGFREDRYLVTKATFVPSPEPQKVRLRGAKFTVPATRIRFVRNAVMRFYNARYYRKATRSREEVVDIESYFFPLDSIGFWNRLYGKNGLVQYQFLLPKAHAEKGWKTIRETLQKAGFFPCLVVIKQHGSVESPGFLSFPAEGYSFALDFPRNPELLVVLQRLNAAIISAGGRIYLTKDDLLSANELERMYSQASTFRESLSRLQAPPIRSALGDRLKFYEMDVSSPRMQKSVFIIGANSDVGIRCAEYYRAAGCNVVLFGHKVNELPQGFETHFLDVAQPDLSVFEGKPVDLVLFTAGCLPDNETAFSGETLQNALAVNFTGNVEIAGYFAQRFSEQKNGTIVGVSSVAAVRGKGSNVIYGAAKAGWDNYLSGLRNYLFHKGIRVLTIRPGYIATKMTAGMPLPKSLTASPEEVAKVIVRHSLNGKRSIVYVKPVWRLIAFIVKHLPEAIAKKLKW